MPFYGIEGKNIFLLKVDRSGVTSEGCVSDDKEFAKNFGISNTKGNCELMKDLQGNPNCSMIHYYGIKTGKPKKLTFLEWQPSHSSVLVFCLISSGPDQFNSVHLVCTLNLAKVHYF